MRSIKLSKRKLIVSISLLIILLSISNIIINKTIMAQRDSASSGAAYTGEIKITVDSYESFKSQVNGLGPFLVYGWLSHGNLGNFNSQVAKLEGTLNDANVSRRAILFSSLEDMDPSLGGRIDDVPSWIDVIFYTTEPSYTPEYNDIFLENENNCVVKATKLAHSYGFPVHWGPLPGSLDFHSGIAASDAVLELFAKSTVHLDGFVSQYQSRIGTACPDNLIWGPLSGKDTVEETIAHLGPFFPYDFEFCVQVMPDGCNQGDALNCGVDHYCRDFASKLQDSGFMDYLAIWVPDAALIKALRQGSQPLTPTPHPTPTPTPTPPPSISLSPGWNEIVWPPVAGKKASDIPAVCPIGVFQENLWFKPFVKNYGGLDFVFESGRNYYLKCNQSTAWNP